MNNDNIKEAAKKYLEKGWGVIPVNFKKAIIEKGVIKKQVEYLPTYREYYSKKILPGEIEGLWNSYYNGIAITAGMISGITIIDVDCKDLAETKDLPETFTVETFKGYHFYYKYNEEIKTGAEPFEKDGKKFNIDRRNDRGIVFADPSEYELPDGTIAKYKIIKDVPLADFPVEWLKNIYKKYKPEGISIKGEFVKKDFGEIISGVNQGERNDAATSLVGTFMSHLPKDKWETYAWPLLSICNTQNTPPLTEPELRTTFASIANKETEKRNASGKTEWTPSVSLIDLLNKEFPEKKWTVENIFQRGTINQLSAPPQQRKTWLTQHIAICVATGEKVFGHFETDKQNVMIVNEEDPESEVKDRLLLLLGEIKDLPIYVHADKGFKLEDELVTKLLKEAKEKNIGLIIFDSLSVIHNAEENSAKEMGAVFEQMKRFSREEITVLFTNHHRKKPVRKWEIDDIQEQTRGSTVINAVPSGHITCEEKNQDGNTFIIIRQAKLKGAKKIDPFLVKVDVSDKKIGFAYEGKHEESLDAATKLRNQLYEIIQKSEAWLGIQDFEEITGKSKSSISKQIKFLAEAKQVQVKTRATLMKEVIDVPKRKNPSGQEFLYFRLDKDTE